jgi:muconolactone D-isomerase
VEFLVEIDVRLPAELSPERREALLAAERERGRALIEAGTLRHIWRLPDRFANVGVWSAADAAELHVALGSLPLHPWMDVRVTPLAVHPLNARGPA